MHPALGRKIISDYIEELLTVNIKSSTRRKLLGRLRQLLAHVLRHPFIPGQIIQSIQEKYGPIEQTITEYDYPKHVVEIPPIGRVLTEDQLYAFYGFLFEYLNQNPDDILAGRDAALIVLAAESDLRARELRMSDVAGPNRTLLYEECAIYTAFGKGFRGSGPIPRLTIFTPLAQSTLRIYTDKVRPRFPNADQNLALFLSINGVRISYKSMCVRLKLWVKRVRASGVDIPANITWHTLRRTFATLNMQLWPTYTARLAAWLGHRTLSTLPRYVLHNQDYIKKTLREFYDDLIPLKEKVEDKCGREKRSK